MDPLFLDANIFFAATASTTGASHALFELAKHKKLRLFSSHYAIREAKTNIEIKLGNHHVPVFYKLVSELHKIDKDSKNPSLEKSIKNYINPKDLPILQSALQLKTNVLISLDKKAFKNDIIKQIKLPLKLMLPGEYLQSL